MIMKASAAAAAIGAAVAFSAPEASAWSLAPLKNRFNTALCAAADSPLFSDDLTSKTYHGPNPQNLKYKETMLRQAYDDWRAKYARGDYDKDRFRIFKLNFLASQKAHEIQTARAKMEGRPLPQLLELNAYGDCTKEEYLLLKDQENNNLIAPRTLKDANNTSATTNTTTAAATNVAATTTIKPTKSTESSQKKPYTIQVDDRGPEIERKATMFPQRSDEPSDDTTPLSPMTPKTPSVKIIQDQLDDLKKATENLAPQPGNQPPQFKSVGSNSQVSKPNSTFLKPDEKGVFPDRSVSFLQSFQKQTSPPKILPKPDQKTKRNIPVNPNPASSFVAPDQLGIFGDKSATTFPKRTAAHALPRAKATVTPANEPLAKGTSPVTTTPGPRASQTSDSSPTVSTPTTSVSQSNTSVPTTSTPALQVSKASASTPSSLTTPKVAPSDQEKRDVANIHPDSLHETPPATFPEPVATEKFNTPETTSSPNSTESAEAKDLNQTPATSTGEITETSTETVTKLEKMEMPKINPGSSYVKPDLRGSFTERSATIFPKRTIAYDAPNKPATLNAKLPTSVSYIKPDVFYREQSATTFPKRTDAHNARTIATEVDGPKNEASTSKTVTPTGEDTARPDAKSGHEAKPQTSPSASFIKPDVFFQERSVSTFPKRTEDHNTRRPVTRLETKASPSLSYIKPDFEYPERSVTTFTPRNDPNDALVKSSMFRDDPPAPHKTLLPDQRRANIADPFSFARKERQDLPPPDFKEPEPTQTEEIITQPGVSFAELTIVESPPTIVESPPAPPATPEDVESLDSTALAPTPPMTIIKKKAEKPEVQVSVPDMTSIQMKLGNAETKNSSQKSKIPSRNLTKAMVPSSESSASKTDRSMQPTKPKVAKNQNDSGSSQRSEAEQRMKKWKESQANGNEASTKSSSDEKKSELLRRSLLKARVEMEQEANQINVEDHLKVEPPKSTQEVVISPPDDVVQRPEAQIDIDMKSTGKQELETSATIATKHVHADRKNASGIDAAARQREIEDALKADFNQAAVVSPNMDPERLQQITAAFEGKPPPPLSPKIETPVPKSNSFTSARVDSTVDPLARKKEIEEALKADFGAAKTVDRQKEIEAVFEGRLPVQAKRGVSPVHDPFAVNSLPSAPPASVDDVLKAEMKAVEALKSTQDPSIKAAEEALLGPKILSIQDILKAEMEAANQLKKTSGVSNGAPVTPVSSQYQGVAPKSEESTKGKSKPEKKIEMAATSHEEKKPKKKRKRNRNKNKNKSSEGGVNESDTSSINGSIKKEDL